VTAADPIAALKVQLQDRVHLPPSQQTLVFNGTQLADSVLIGDVLQRDATVQLVYAAVEPAAAADPVIDSQTAPLPTSIAATELIAGLKRQLEQLEALPVHAGALLGRVVTRLKLAVAETDLDAVHELLQKARARISFEVIPLATCQPLDLH
jgi:hypothetical protein